MRRTAWTSMLMFLVLSAPLASAATLGPWTLGPATNGYFEHNGISGVPGHLYVVSGPFAEVAPILGDGSVGAWLVTSSLNLPRSFGQTFATSTHVYVVGGWPPGPDPGAGGTETATAEVAAINPDGTLGPWTYTSPMLAPRGNHAGALGAGRIYVLGTYGGTNSVESAAIQADGTLSAWRQETPMQQTRQRPAAGVIDGYLYVIGGLGFTTTVERAPIGPNGVLGAWQYVASTIVPRYQHGAAAIGSVLFAVGGYNDNDGTLASIELSDFAGAGIGAWSYASTMVHTRGAADATSVGNVLYAIGSNLIGPRAGVDNTVEFASVPGTCPTCPACSGTPGPGDDEDSDGVLDANEASPCLGTKLGAPVTARGCDVDQACPCGAPLGRSAWTNHRDYLTCVKGTARELRAHGSITRDQRGALIKTAAHSNCGR